MSGAAGGMARVDAMHETDPLLMEFGVEQWKTITEEERGVFLTETDQLVRGLVTELYESSDRCVEQFTKHSQGHVLWRRIMIIGTAVIAMVNLVAAAKNLPPGLVDFAPTFAGILALILALLANLESLSNSLEKAQ